MKRIALGLALVLAGLPGFALAAEKQIGNACTSDQNSADFDTIAQCQSGTFVKAPLFMGSATGYACTGGAHAGLVQWTGSAFQACDGNSWSAIQIGNTPVAFNFTDQTGVNTSTTITSNSVTVSGFSGALTATCAGCSAIARNGSWGSTTVAGFQASDTIAIRATSSASPGTAVTASVTLGGRTSGTWTVTTTASNPNAFSFTDVTGATTSLTYSSNAVTLGGFSGSLTATCSGACYGIARNGTWGGTSLSGFVSGDTIALRLNSAAGAAVATTAAAIVGNTTSSTWTVTTSAACQGGITVGQTCPDGSIFAGTSPDGSVSMYTTPCDAGYYLSSGTCTACSSGLWSGSGSTCSTTYASTKYPSWNYGGNNWVATGYTSSTTGRANTTGLIALSDSASPYNAAKYCGTLSAFSKSDWYLPAQDELNALYTNRVAIANFDTADGGTLVSGAYPGLYWASSETGSAYAGGQIFSDGSTNVNGIKAFQFSVRCIRR
jgi:hypothetical protein